MDNPFDQFDTSDRTASNPFDQFDAPVSQVTPDVSKDVQTGLLSGAIKGGANLAGALAANTNPITGAIYDIGTLAKYGIPAAEKYADYLASDLAAPVRRAMGNPDITPEQEQQLSAPSTLSKIAQNIPTPSDAVSYLAKAVGHPIEEPQTPYGKVAEGTLEYGGLGGAGALKALPSAFAATAAPEAVKGLGGNQQLQDWSSLAGGLGVGKAAAESLPDFKNDVKPAPEPPKNPEGIGADDLRQMAKSYYDYSKNQGVDFSPDAQTTILDAINNNLSKTGKMNNSLHGNTLSVLEDLKNDANSGNLDLETLHQYRQLFGDVINNNLHPNGKMKPDAMKANSAIDAIDGMLDQAKDDPSMLSKGTPDAINAWQQGQQLWAASARASDIERIMNRAEFMQNPATSMRQGFASLAGNPARFNKFTPEQQEMIKDAASSNLGIEAMRAIGSRLIPYSLLGAHNPLAALAAIPIGEAGRNFAADMQAKRGQKVINDIVANAPSKFQEPLPAQKPLQLPSLAINVPAGGFGVPEQEQAIQEPQTNYNPSQRALPAPREMTYEDMVRSGRVLPSPASTPINVPAEGFKQSYNPNDLNAPDEAGFSKAKTTDTGAQDKNESSPVIQAQNTLQQIATGEPIDINHVKSDEAITSTGRSVPVDYAIANVNDLNTSHLDDLRPNPQYPQQLQPRDRTRGATRLQMTQMLNPDRFKPQLLGESPDASNGAPIVASDGVVESGNMRSMALRNAYNNNLPAAKMYKQWLQDQGYPIEGVKNPVLVRVNRGNMTTGEREALTREANQPAQLSMSSTERAQSDAKALPDSVMDLAKQGDLHSMANRQFVRSALKSIANPNEMGGLVTPDGVLSQDGVRRIQGAVMAKAYGDPTILQNLIESTDNNYKSIGNALIESAPMWSKMRSAIESGRVPSQFDITPNLTEAINLISRARSEGKPISDFVNQADIFTGKTISPETETMLSWMLGGKDFTSRMSQSKIAQAVQFYAQEAMKVENSAGIFGESEQTKPQELMELARAKSQSGQQAASLFGSPMETPRSSAVVRTGSEGNGGQNGGQGINKPRPTSPSGFFAAEKNQTETPNLDSSALESLRPSLATRTGSSPATQAPLRQTSDLNLPEGVFTTRATSPSTNDGGVSYENNLSMPSVYHQINDAQTLKNLAVQSKDDFNGLLTSISNQIKGAKFDNSRVKDDQGLSDKLQTREPNEVSDYLGGRIVVNSRSAAENVLDRLRQNATVTHVDDFMNDEGRPNGYRAIHAQILGNNGMSAEVQIQPQQINKLLDTGHALYKQQKQEFNNGNFEKAGQLATKQRLLYNAAWNKFNKK